MGFQFIQARHDVSHLVSLKIKVTRSGPLHNKPINGLCIQNNQLRIGDVHESSFRMLLSFQLQKPRKPIRYTTKYNLWVSRKCGCHILKEKYVLIIFLV